MLNMPNITYKGDRSGSLRASDDPIERIIFYKDREYFDDLLATNKFIDACEKAIRTSKEYKKFISYVKGILGINYCQITSNVIDDYATVEMHHGPLFTLYDYCAIILNSFIDNNKDITTFRIVNEVINEHFLLNVQVVMLSTTAHEAVTNNDIFLNIKQGIGYCDRFIEKYKNNIRYEQRDKIIDYIEFSKHNPSFDYGILNTIELEKMIDR